MGHLIQEALSREDMVLFQSMIERWDFLRPSEKPILQSTIKRLEAIEAELSSLNSPCFTLSDLSQLYLKKD
jgi:hypothetical protein